MKHTLVLAVLMTVVFGCSKNDTPLDKNSGPDPVEVRLDELRWSWVEVSWSEAKDSDGNLTTYVIKLNGETKSTVDLTTTEIRIDGLMENTDYTLVVEARDAKGASSTSNTLSFNTGNMPSIEKTTLFFSDITSNSAKLNWGVATTPDNLVVNQVVFIGTEIVGEGIEGNEFTLTNLSSNTEYDISLFIGDDSGVFTSTSIPLKTL